MNFASPFYCFLFAFSVSLWTLASGAEKLPKTFPKSNQALTKLIEGNQRFIKKESCHPCPMNQAKNNLLEKQTPFAAIVGCSDSRVPPELVFDAGLGELFVVRDAGNVIGPIEMDSIEFAAAKLNVSLIVVLGHQNCGAIAAAIEGKDHVPELDQIYPYIDTALKSCNTGVQPSLIEAIKCNIKQGVNILHTSPTIAPLIKAQQLTILGAYFDIASGKVTFLED